MRRLTTILVAMLVLAAAACAPGVAPLPVPAVPDPAGDGVAAERDLGTWDDALAVPDEDRIVLRRGAALWSYGPGDPHGPQKVAETPVLAGAEIVAAVPSGNSTWVLLQSRDACPFAFDLTTGRTAAFEVPGAPFPGGEALGIQSRFVLPQAGAALVMVSGGGQARPAWFRLDLRSGEVARIPVGWDLQFLSADLRVAVFATPSTDRSKPRPLAAIDVATGAQVARVPDRAAEPFVPFEWTDHGAVRPICERRPGAGDRDFVVGLSAAGDALRFEWHHDPGGEEYLAGARAGGDHMAFRLRRGGAGARNPSPLWVVGRHGSAAPVRVAENSIYFELLADGNCVWTFQEGPVSDSRSDVACVRVRATGEVRSLVDGLPCLPPLPAELQRGVHDATRIRLVPAFGRGAPSVLGLVAHRRHDMRSLPLPLRKDGTPGELPGVRRVRSEFWSRALLVGADGDVRSTTRLRDREFPDIVWLHTSGRVYEGAVSWIGEGETRRREVRLTEAALECESLQR